MNTETVPGSPSASPAPPSASPAPKASDRKLSKSPYLSLGTVQETGELDFSDFEKAGGGGVKKGIFTEVTGEKHPRESDEIARPSKQCRE